MKSLLLLALGLARTVVLGARIEAERIVVSVRPYKREQRRCPVCGRACDFYDMANRGAPRLWRAMDLARSACYLEYAPCRVRCPEHGVRTEAVPWARHGARFTRDFEDCIPSSFCRHILLSNFDSRIGHADRPFISLGFPSPASTRSPSCSYCR